MKCFQLEIKGNWAHFKRPETNNNPLTHDMITKTALIGMMGAVLGIERKSMRLLFPILSEDILYNVQLLHPVKKVSVGFTSCKALRPAEQGTPKRFEMLKDPDFLVTIALKDKRSGSLFNRFVDSIKNSETIYPPCLGWHNCPAELYYISEGELSDETFDGTFETTGFVTTNDFKLKNIPSNVRIGFEKLPTYQNDDFWNLPEKYVNVIYAESSIPLTIETIKNKGRYRKYSHDTKEECLCLI